MKNAVSILSAIAHEGRLGLFRQLVKAGADGLAVGELAQLARANITTVSAQLSVLDHAGLVERRRDGRSIIYTANYQRASALLAFMMDNCCQGRAEIVGPLANIANDANRD